MFVFQQINLFIIFVIAALVLTQIIFFITNRYRTLIHDAVSYTVVIDMNEQMIFDTEEQLIKYKEANAQKSAEKERAGYLGGRNG